MLLNACALVSPGVASTLAEVLDRHPLLASRSHAWTAMFEPIATFPVVLRQPVPVSGNVMNAGDAAGFVDPFIGDGIALALRGGNLAARNLRPFLNATAELKQSLEGYAAAYRQALSPAYRASSLLRKFMGVPRALRGAVLAACESSPRLASYLVEATRSKPIELEPEFHQ
jgi:flavin-dependent dehydrogenase